MSNPHALLMPIPAQGHVIPYLELSQRLASHGVRVTLVNSEYNHKRVLKSLEEKDCIDEKIHLVSIPDGMEPWEDRNDLRKFRNSMMEVYPGKLQQLIEQMNRTECEKIDCVISDFGCAIRVAEKMKIRRAVFWTTAAAILASTFSIPKLIDDGIIDENGTPIKKQTIQLATNMPKMNDANFIWLCPGDLATQNIIFELAVYNMKSIKMANCLVCNSSYDLEPEAVTVVPGLMPIGPLLASSRLGNSVGNLWPEDSTCLKWLDQQPKNSVLYAAFGSFTIFDKTQFQQLALGLELCNRQFLWAVRPNITNDADDAYPQGFLERVASRGKIVEWAPQQKVLSHPSIAGFLTHCGWNSIMEGISNGVPFLCWPYFADQMLNQSYISDIWKVGLGFEKNESGIITKEEIKSKIEQVLGDETFKARSVELKEKAMNSIREGGTSNKTFQSFIEWVKA